MTGNDRTGGRRSIALSASAAVWGIAVAFALAPFLFVSPGPDAPASAATAAGTHPSASFYLVTIVLLVPLLFSALYARVAPRIPSLHDALPRIIFASSIVLVLWMTTLVRDGTSLTLALTVPGGVLAATPLLHRCRFSRWDVLLLPTALAVYFALLDLLPVHWVFLFVLAVLLTFALRIAVAFTTVMPRDQGLVLFLAPLALVPVNQHLPIPDLLRFTLTLLLIAIAIPIGILVLRRKQPGTIKRWLTFAIFPLVAFLYPHTQDPVTLEGAPRIDIFEDGHSLLPASEWLRGELPYRDIIPGHGFLSDGGLAWLAMLIGGDEAGVALRAEHWLMTLNAISIYALTLAASASAPAALLAGFFSTAFFDSGVGFFRTSLPLLMLAFVVAAVRTGRSRWWRASGITAPLAGIAAVEFAAYSLFTTVVAILRERGWKKPALAFGRGLLITAIPILVVFSIFQFTDDFIRVTIMEVLTLGPVYNLGPGGVPELIARSPHFPELLRPILFPRETRYILWFFALIGVATLLPRSVSASRRSNALFLVLLWTVLAGFSWAERHHLYFQFTLPALIATSVVFLWRRNTSSFRLAAVIVGVATVVSLGPTTHLVVATTLRASNDLLRPGVRVEEPPRARGVLFDPVDADRVERFERVVISELNADETWFDFSNRPLLYFLWDRNCPIRQYEVPFFQRDRSQLEVIRRLQRNPSVRLALIRFGDSDLDGIPNRDRTPIVWNWLRTNFEPWHDDGDIEVWKRRSGS